ncbi:MAG: hypothetical protein NT062_36325 [Proteobacteria bacterium]|nr:hypothetical protein [Pseudomonadota bacterium]
MLADVLETRRERRRRRGHAAMEAEQEQMPRATCEGAQIRFEEPVRHVFIKRELGGRHRVFEEPAVALHERSLEELLRLAAQRALTDGRHAAPELVLLAVRDLRVVAGAEHFSERLETTEQCAGRFHVLHESPKLGQRVLQGRRGEQQHRRGPDRVAHALRDECLARLVLVAAELVEAMVDARKPLVRLVDHDEIEGGAVRENA